MSQQVLHHLICSLLSGTAYAGFHSQYAKGVTKITNSMILTATLSSLLSALIRTIN